MNRELGPLPEPITHNSRLTTLSVAELGPCLNP
jgi:hypothetical protein